MRLIAFLLAWMAFCGSLIPMTVAAKGSLRATKLISEEAASPDQENQFHRELSPCKGANKNKPNCNDKNEDNSDSIDIDDLYSFEEQGVTDSIDDVALWTKEDEDYINNPNHNEKVYSSSYLSRAAGFDDTKAQKDNMDRLEKNYKKLKSQFDTGKGWGDNMDAKERERLPTKWNQVRADLKEGKAYRNKVEQWNKEKEELFKVFRNNVDLDDDVKDKVTESLRRIRHDERMARNKHLRYKFSKKLERSGHRMSPEKKKNIQRAIKNLKKFEVEEKRHERRRRKTRDDIKAGRIPDPFKSDSFDSFDDYGLWGQEKRKHIKPGFRPIGKDSKEAKGIQKSVDLGEEKYKSLRYQFNMGKNMDKKTRTRLAKQVNSLGADLKVAKAYLKTLDRLASEKQKIMNKMQQNDGKDMSIADRAKALETLLRIDDDHQTARNQYFRYKLGAKGQREVKRKDKFGIATSSMRASPVGFKNIREQGQSN